MQTSKNRGPVLALDEIKKGSCRYEGMMSPPDYARCYYSHAVTTLSWQQSKVDNDGQASPTST
eukprot:scaffold85_cov135-Skeletonema_marinoi.AAC.2